MQIKRRAVTVGVTFFLAAATGHVMQNGETITARLRGVSEAERPAPATATVTKVASAGASAVEEAKAPVKTASAIAREASLPDLPATRPSPFKSGVLLAARMESVGDGYQRPATDADARYSVFGIACADTTASIEATARAVLRVTLAAPCFPSDRITIHHAGLSFVSTTDKVGDLELIVPAMVADAEVEIQFSSGESLTLAQPVSGLDSLHRVAVQWQGETGFRLHAFEEGATFGSPGHVSAANPRDRSTPEGGFLTLLGNAEVDQPQLAEVYTAPAVTNVDDLLVEADVTSANCGRDLEGQTLRMSMGSAPMIEDLSFAMPDCGAVGDYLSMSLGPIAGTSAAVILSANE